MNSDQQTGVRESMEPRWENAEGGGKKADGNLQLYRIDWETAEVSFAKGRMRQTLRRPTADEIFKRESDLEQEVPMKADGSYALPDPTVAEAVNAELYDKLVTETAGEEIEIWDVHKSQALESLYSSEIEVEGDALGEEVVIAEEIGSGDWADFTVRHILRRPTRAELDSYRRKAAVGSYVKPGKRGRQILVTRSNLKNIVPFYDLWTERVDGATVDGEVFSEGNKLKFVGQVDPLVKRKVVQVFAEAIVQKLSD
ncbi:MAG: hypothetical protein IT174_10810 [Acidobacteria bacterium]|nr:hypothetical protein [Acidobacteriota bacterium]